METQSRGFSALSIVAVACILVCLGTAIYPEFNSASIGQLLFGAVFFTALLSVPFLVLWYFGRKVRSPWFSGLFIVAMFVALGWWGYIFWETFFLLGNKDPQSALVYVLAPLYSSIAAGIFGKVSVWLDARISA